MKYLFMAFCSFLILHANAQQNTFTAKKVNIMEVNDVKVIKHTGSQIVFEKSSGNCEGADVHEEDDDDRAKGLSSINAQGLKDNTGVGLNVEKKGDELIVSQISPNNDYCYLVKVPSGTNIYYEHSSHQGDDLRFENLDGEVEVTATYNDVYLKDLTGPTTINTIYGGIEGNFSSINQASPITLHSVYDHIDVKVPNTAKAKFILKTSYGEIFTDLDLQVEQKDGMRKLSTDNITGTLNGGGVDFTIKATYDNIYLRKG